MKEGMDTYTYRDAYQPRYTTDGTNIPHSLHPCSYSLLHLFLPFITPSLLHHPLTRIIGRDKFSVYVSAANNYIITTRVGKRRDSEIFMSTWRAAVYQTSIQINHYEGAFSVPLWARIELSMLAAFLPFLPFLPFLSLLLLRTSLICESKPIQRIHTSFKRFIPQ